jgi:hypothetical protein
VTCLEDGCDQPAAKRRLCTKHYQRRRAHGIELPPPVVRNKHLPCTVDGCSEPRWIRGYCRLHHNRWQRNGDPLVEKRSSTPLQKMQRHIEVTGFCWLWRGALDGQGYGQLKAPGNTTVRAHRWVYEQLVGPIPDGLQLDHLCRVIICVNPDHLDPVTQAENVRRGWAYQPVRDRQKGAT